jgi:hypothetical protein
MFDIILLQVKKRQPAANPSPILKLHGLLLLLLLLPCVLDSGLLPTADVRSAHSQDPCAASQGQKATQQRQRQHSSSSSRSSVGGWQQHSGGSSSPAARVDRR